MLSQIVSLYTFYSSGPHLSELQKLKSRKLHFPEAFAAKGPQGSLGLPDKGQVTNEAAIMRKETDSFSKQEAEIHSTSDRLWRGL